MRVKTFAVLFLFFTLIVAFQNEVIAWGPLTHMTLLDDILKDVSLNPDVKRILQENLKHAKGGATGPDMYYFIDKRYADIAHYCSPGDFTRKMLEMAKKDGDPKKIAFAYGWMIHVATDPIGHQWVNSLTGGEYDPENSEIKRNHSNIEQSIDKKNLTDHAKKLIDPITGKVLLYSYDMDIDSPDIFNFKVFSNYFGCRENAPTADIGEVAENIAQLAYNGYPSWIMRKDENQFNTDRYQKAYQDSVLEAIRALNSAGVTLDNWDLDTGEAPKDKDGNPNPDYGGYQKCEDFGKLKNCGPVTRTGPGGDHPDDTVSVGEGNLVLENVPLDSLYRLAAKKGGKWIFWLKSIQNANAEYNALSSDTSPELRQEKLNKISILTNHLNNPFDFREFSTNNQQLSSEMMEVPDIAVLENGYTEEMTSLVNRYKEPVRTISLDFTPDIIEDHPIFIIPSGGLMGVENSNVFKAKLDEYVKRGGTLIVFAQQHGYEFAALPVPQEEDGSYKTVGGYGWYEDQSCFVNAAYIETWHQILAGQTKSTPTLHLDGYFTTYPSNATVLLRRTANGQPALLIYEYGQGQVIITSMYSDFALKQKQASSEEIALVRDMISWAKKAVELPEVKPGETVSVSVEVKNITTNDAVSIKLLIYNPNRSILLSEQTVNHPISAGQSVTIPITYTTTPTSALGIYHIDYTLLDAQGNIIQPQAETDSGRFVVSKPPQISAQAPQIKFAVQSDSEDYVAGSTVNFTIIAFNNSDIDRTVTAKVFDWYSFPVRTQTLIVPARGSASFAYSKIARPDYNHYGHYYGRLWASFYEDNAYLGASSKIYWVHSPSVKGTVQTDKSLYKKGETVTINISLKNNIRFSWEPTVRTTVVEPLKFTTVFEDSKTVTLPPYGTGSVVSTFALPPTLTMGTYVVQVSLSTWEYVYTRFEVVQSQISVQANLPSVFTSGTNTIPFTISNTGKINVSSGTLDLSLKAPDESIVYSGNRPFSLTLGESKTLDVPISIPALKFGNYTLTYTQSDETRAGIPTNITIPNSVDISPSFDKPSYRVRETANLKVDLTNTGKFNLGNISLVVSAPDANYTDTKTLSLGVNPNATSLNFEIPIPETISAGLHDVNVVLTLPGGDSVTKNTGIFVPASLLSIKYQGATTLSAGDTLEMIIENSGGVDTHYEAYIYFSDQGYWFFDSKSATGSIQTGAQSLLSYTLPDQLTNGGYTLGIEVIDKKTNKITSKYILLSIAGLSGELLVRTDKDIYLSTEETTTLSTIVNQGKPMADGNLHLEIACAEYIEAPELTSFHIFTEENYIWTERGVLHFPGSYEQQEFPLPITPNQWGNASVRIQHEGAQSAFLDYIALRDSNGNLYSPYFVGAPEQTDNTSEAQGIDEVAAWVTGQNFYAYWNNLPSGVSYTLVMVAKEGCGIVWQTDTIINQGSGVIETLNIPAGVIGRAGKYYLRGELINIFGQIIGTSYYPFYIIDGDTVLLFNTDKRIYRPGETVTITGQIENRAPIMAENLTCTLNSSQGGQTPQLLLTETINIPAGGTYPFTITTTAGEEGVVTLSGRVKQNNEVLVSITDQYEVALPYVSSYVNVPDRVGNEPFTIEVEIWNDGKVDAIVQFGVQSPDFGDLQTITVPPGETRLIQYQQQNHQATAYTFTFSGDLDQSFTRTVSYGLGASIEFGVGSAELGVFSEGSVAVPVTLTNTGQSTVTLEVTYQLNPGATQQSKTYSLPVGGSATDTLYFDLAEGDYQITASSQRPDATAQANFSVRKENQVEMAVTSGTQTDGLIPVNVNLTNRGFNEINGSVNVSVSPSTGQAVWNGGEPISQLLPQNSQLITLNINPSAIEPGNYNLQVQLLNNSNQFITVQS